MRSQALVAAVVLLLPLTSGCFDFLGRFEDHQVARTPVDTVGWNREALFTVQVHEVEPVDVRIEATATDGRVVTAAGPSSATLPPVEVLIPDGTWTIRYFLDGKRWETFKAARFDSTAPSVTGLQTLGDAESGQYIIGEGAIVESGATVQVIDQGTGLVIANSLPKTVTIVASGIHAYDVVITDLAGNQLVEQVQVRSGSASQLPVGQHTLGLVARYTLQAELWDISNLGAWGTPAQSRAAVADAWLGSGRAIAPQDDAVKAVVATEVTAGMTTGEAAFALFRWMADELDYDKARLELDDLLEPAQTIDNGGGVCRDLAALYVSLLRSAGIPARLVTGYLGGEVNGFHAWVEFYGGSGHGPLPWVPVDVSAITGPYAPETALQAFGLRHTDMMPLRVVTEAQEQGAWSTAVAVSTRFPANQEPVLDLAKELTPQFEVTGTLCVDPLRLARLVIAQQDTNKCPRAYTHGFTDFVRSASQVLDYGAQVTSASSGTTVTLTLSYPDEAAVAPGQVEQLTYCEPAANCESFRKDAGRGVTVGTWAS